MFTRQHFRLIANGWLLVREGYINLGSQDKTIIVWDVNNGSYIFVMHADSAVRSVAFSPYDEILASG